MARCHKSWPWTLVHSPLEVTHPSHGLFTPLSYRSHTDYISHQSQHYTITWFQSQLLPISITPAPHSLLYISSLHTHTHCEVLFLPRLTFLSVSPFFWFWFLCLTPDCPDTLNLCLWPRLLPGTVYVSALPLIFLFLPADHCVYSASV